MATSDFVIIGGGIIGLAIALEIRRAHPGESVTLLEKEDSFGAHASGRNSGVLHAGFYYSADSMKARFCAEGNRALRDYCASRALPVSACGKLVVARGESELPALDELLARGERNGVRLEMVSRQDALRIEPRARTYERALHSPDTATVDPGKVMQALCEDASAAGIRLLAGTRYLGRRGGELFTNRGAMSAGYVINAAGLHADRVARGFGFGEDYRILPFKGLYLYSSKPAGWLGACVYPVPDLRNPFLGVHFTVAVDGSAKIGPTAIPCLWREQYGWLQSISPRDAAECAPALAALLWAGRDNMRSLAVSEIRKCSRRHLAGLAGELVEGVQADDFRRWGRPGIRAQLVHRRERRLVMDFCLEGDRGSMHVLNAVSPAFTCSLPFAAHVADRVEAALAGETVREG